MISVYSPMERPRKTVKNSFVHNKLEYLIEKIIAAILRNAVIERFAYHEKEQGP